MLLLPCALLNECEARMRHLTPIFCPPVALLPAQGLPLMATMDRRAPRKEKSQIFFIDVFVVPMFEPISRLCAIGKECLENLEANRRHWSDLSEAQGMEPACCAGLCLMFLSYVCPHVLFYPSPASPHLHRSPQSCSVSNVPNTSKLGCSLTI